MIIQLAVQACRIPSVYSAPFANVCVAEKERNGGRTKKQQITTTQDWVEIAKHYMVDGRLCMCVCVCVHPHCVDEQRARIVRFSEKCSTLLISVTDK